MATTSQIKIYQANDDTTQINVKFEEETVWLIQDQIAILLGKGRSTITEHILNVFSKKELEQEAM